MYLGVDIGGTFTDLVMMDDDGRISTAKALTTPGELETGVLDAIALAAEARGLAPDELLRQVVVFGHGTTQATNALIERDRRAHRSHHHAGFRRHASACSASWDSPPDSRSTSSAGTASAAIPIPSFRASFAARCRNASIMPGPFSCRSTKPPCAPRSSYLSDRRVETFAVALLWSFRNPTHERRVGEIIRELRPDAYVSLSCEVSPIIGEYERTATTALNSYLALKVVSYLERMEGRAAQSAASRGKLPYPQQRRRGHAGPGGGATSRCCWWRAARPAACSGRSSSPRPSATAT